jgi:H+/Cl- antiporter ClcA
MIDTLERPRSYLKLMVLVGLLGIISAVITFVFIIVVNQGIRLLWEEAAQAIGLDRRLFTLLVCTLGGLLVGLLVKIFGDHTGIFAEIIQEFGKTGRFDYRNAPGIVITALVSLISGASLGPEAPLADATGGIGTWLSDRLKLNDNETRTMGFGGFSSMLGAFITSPFGGAILTLEMAAGGESAGPVYFWGLFPSLLASAVATVVFVWLAGGFFQTLYAFPDYTPRLLDLLVAVPFALLGGLAGVVFMLLLRGLRKLVQPMKSHVVWRGLIGGLGMGIIGALLPLTLFSGEAETLDLIAQATEIGFWMLLLLAVAKLFATSFMLATGWKGGYLFPIMFAGIALGMSGKVLFPSIPTAVPVAAALAGALTAALRAPLFAALFTLAMVQAETAPVVAVSVLAGALLTAVLGQRMTRRAQAKAQSVADQSQSQQPQEPHETESVERAKEGGAR